MATTNDAIIHLWQRAIDATFKTFQDKFNTSGGSTVEVSDLYAFQSCLKVLCLAPSMGDFHTEAMVHMGSIQKNLEGEFDQLLTNRGIDLQKLLVNANKHIDEGTRMSSSLNSVKRSLMKLISHLSTTLTQSTSGQTYMLDPTIPIGDSNINK